ncbi:helix-turn-helix domain-containing protein [Catellatospora vulcania]|uniref:helix-turn-helix domain-containing protein n=1 Tax=Catellatospora vulcania TaxID=1460450 RepID=UPI0012D3D2B8|nr:helix-turn-helix transcriptional regulator [Catellatospora vulcania]
MSAQSPAVARLRLRHALRSAREGSDYTQEQVASELEWSLSKVIRIENGTVRMTVTDVRALMQLYGIDDASEMSEMESLVRASRQRSWWTQYGSEVMSGRFATYIGLEDGASALAMYQALVVPGLLQTEAYARAVIAGLRMPEEDTRNHETYLDIRLRRQENVLQRKDPPQIHAVLDEAVLRRINGGVGVQRDQLLHLVSLGAAPHIHLRVLPLSTGIHTMESTFVLLSFPFGEDVVYLELNSALAGDPDRGQFLDRGEVAAPYRDTFTMLTGAALSEADSLAFIAKVAGDLR